MRLTVPFAAPKQQSQCVNPDQLKTERLENNLRLYGKCWLNSLKFSFLMKMTKVFFILPALDARSQTSASKIAETELENLFSNLLRLVADKRLLVAPDMSVPGISPEVLQRVLSQANRPHV